MTEARTCEVEAQLASLTSVMYCNVEKNAQRLLISLRNIKWQHDDSSKFNNWCNSEGRYL